MKIYILTKFRELWLKTVLSKVDTRFSIIWPSDQGFDPTCPSFELNLDFMRIIFLTKFHKGWIKTVPSRVYTRFFYNLTEQPRFWSNMTHFQWWPRFYFMRIIILTKLHELLIKTVPSRVCTRFFYNLTFRPSFRPNIIQFWSWPRFYDYWHSNIVS